jgi:MFS family permease
MSFPAVYAVAHKPSLGATLSICTASQVLATSSVLGLATISPIVAAKLSIPTYLIGYQVSLIYFAGIFASSVSGSLVKRWGAARLNQIALFCAAGGMLGLATGLIWIMIAGSLLIGIGYAFNNPCSSHMLHRQAPARLRNIIFSIKQAGVPAGGVLAALAIPPLTESFGFRIALALSAIPCLLLGMLFGILRDWWDDDRKPETRIGGRAIWAGQKLIWSRPDMRAISLLGFFYSAVQLCVSAFTVTMLVADFGWTPVQAGGVAAIVQICGAVGRVLWGVVADIMQAGFLVLSGLGVVTGLCCILLLWSGEVSIGAEVALLCVLGACAVGWNGVMLAETARITSKASGGSGTMTGDVMVYTFIGVVFGPSIFALLCSHLSSYAESFAWFSLPAIAGGLLAAWAYRRSASQRWALESG